MIADMRYALRQLAKSPGFTTVAVLTLALGIGACTAMFSVINSALLQPLPYPEPERLVEVWSLPPSGVAFRGITGPQFKEMREHATVFEQIAIENPVAFSLLDQGRTELVRGIEVSGSYLEVLRVSPQLGRTFPQHADQIGGENNAVILTDGFWRSRFGADPTIVGRTITLNQVPRSVIGVLPPGAIPRDDVGFLVPLVLEGAQWLQNAESSFVPVVARLSAGTTLADAQGQAEALAAAVQARLVPDRPWLLSIRLRPLQEVLLAGSRPTIWVLFGAVSFVLLIACANVANLLLVRATARQREMAVRSALGASAGRIVRLVLVESMALALLGGAAGVLLALFGVDLLGRMIVSELPGMMQPQVDLIPLGFSFAIAVGTGVSFGLFPALRARSIDLTRDLKESGRGSSPGGRSRVQSALVVAEVAITASLLVGTGLLLRSFAHLVGADLGFDPRQALVCDVTMERRDVDAAMELHREMIDRLSELPGVEAVGTCTTLPLSGPGWGGRIGPAEKPMSEHNTGSLRDFVGGRYFEAMRIPLVRGRYLADSDNRTDAPPVAVINEVVAANLWPGIDPIGRSVVSGGKTYEVIGVVRSTRHEQVEHNPWAHIYMPHVFSPQVVRIVLRTRVPPLSLADEVRRAISGIDPGQSVSNVRSMEQAMSSALRGRRVALALIGAFAACALGLACLGIYGVMAYTISQRERELGIRLALGASPRGLLQLVVRDGLRLVLLGVAVGVLVALGGSRLIASLLHGVGANDPIVFAVVPLALGLAALAACWLPARRATRVDPIVALRAE